MPDEMVGEPVIAQIRAEEHQGHETRKPIYKNLQDVLGRPVISYFTSFSGFGYPAMMTDVDADMIEGVLQKMDLSNGLALLISSPGGNGLAAERIINICRNYSGTGEYWAVVPSKAKSAATMICFGASKIIMSASSELGPIDPQITITIKNEPRTLSVYNIVKSYEELFKKAVAEKEGNLEPYLQQLDAYDEREIKEFKRICSLSEDIAIRTLQSGMMKGKSNKDIKKKIELSLTPKIVHTHGRPIFKDDALNCSLNVEYIPPKDLRWEVINELYIRLNNFVSGSVPKCIENEHTSFYAALKPVRLPEAGGEIGE